MTVVFILFTFSSFSEVLFLWVFILFYILVAFNALLFQWVNKSFQWDFMNTLTKFLDLFNTLLMLETRSEGTNLNIENGIIISVLSKSVRNSIHEIKLKKHHKLKKKKFCFLCRSQTNSLLLILGAYVVIFLIASVILILSVLKLQNLSENEKFDTNIKTSENMYKLKYDSLIKPKDNLFPEMFFKEFMWPYRSSLFNCSNLSEVKRFNYVTSGWTKNVFSFEHGGKKYAMKTVNIEGIDMKKCMEKETSKTCFDKASSKLYKEYILSRELSHSNIVKVLAWCVSSNNFSNNVAIVTELCSPLDLIMLLRMSFQQRLKIMLDLSQLMAFLAESPLGSVAINDFQRQQFIMCGDVLKLTDLDDLSIEEPKCTEHKHCLQKKLISNSESDGNHTYSVECKNHKCIGYNEKQNVVNAFKHFVNMFLNITTPALLKKDVETLFNSYTSYWSAKTVLRQTEILYVKYNYVKNKIFNKNIKL